MKMKEMINKVTPTKQQVKDFTKLVLFGTPVAFGLNACKTPAPTVVAVVDFTCKENAPVKNDLPKYEIKVGMGGSSTTTDGAKTGISINNTGNPKNALNYYFLPSNADAKTLYGDKNVSATKDAITSEYGVTQTGLFGKNDSVNVGMVASKQIMEFLSNSKIINVSGGYTRLAHYDGKTLYLKPHTGYATESEYVVARNKFGLAGVWAGADEKGAYSLWVIPENRKTYTVKKPFSVEPVGDAAIRLDSNFSTYTSDCRRQIEIRITNEIPVKPAAEVRDFKYASKPTGALAYSDGTGIVYTAVDAAYAADSVMKYAIGDSAFYKSRGDTAIAEGQVKLDSCRIYDALGKPAKAGLGIIMTRTGVLATYYRLNKNEAKAEGAAMVQVPLTKYSLGLEVIEECTKAQGLGGEVFKPVVGKGQGLFSFMTNVPNVIDVLDTAGKPTGIYRIMESDTMMLNVVRKCDGDVISLKMGMAGVSKITHTEDKNGDISVDVFGADGKRLDGLIISKGVPYEPLREKNDIKKDLGMVNKYNKAMYSDLGQQEKNRSRFAGRSI